MKRILSAVILLCAVFAVTTTAQNVTGRLTGTISSPDGVLPNATVVITDNATGKEKTIQSNESGGFSDPSLNPGLYTVRVTASGFKTFQANLVKIDVGREYVLDVLLEIGDVGATVTVTAGADVINSTNAELSNTVSPRQVLELPLNGRNPLGLVGLQPGATANRGNGSEIIGGARTSSTNFTRDGINVQDPFIRNGFVTDTPTVDNTAEFTVVTGNAGAESGFGSSQVQLSTPRGGKDFRGALFLFNRNSKFSANNFFSNAAGRFLPTDATVLQGRATAGDLRQPRAFLNRNQFGGKIGGPLPLPYFGEGTPTLLKDKAFFFFSTEKFLLRQQTPKTALILTPSARNGIFSYRPTGTPAAGQCITFANGICTVNVLNGQGFIGNTIPTSSQGTLTLNPVAANRFLAGIPTTGNRSDLGDGLNTTGFGFNQSDPEDRIEYTGRIDANINDNNSVFGTYRYNKTDDARTDIDTTFNQTAQAKTSGPTKFLSLGYTSNISSNFSNTLRGGTQKADVVFLNGVLPTSNFLLGTSTAVNGVINGGLVTNPELNFRDQGRNTETIGIIDDATHLIGNHSVRFGGSYQRYKIKSFNLANVGVPTYSLGTVGNPNTPRLPFSGTGSIYPGGVSAGDANTADSLRYLLAGIIGSGSVAANATSTSATAYTPGARLDRNLKYSTYAAYVSDQWKVFPNFTLNLGVRYELYSPLKSTDGLYLEVAAGSDPVSTLLNESGSYRFVGGNAGSSGSFAKTDKNNFAPVLSFAYSPSARGGFLKYIFGGDNKTVIRGGYRSGFVNDEYIRSQDNANANNAGLSATAFALNGSSGFLNDRLDALTVPTAPTYQVPPRTFADNNTLAFANRFGTVSLIDPNLQIQRSDEYNFGIQREFGSGTVLEVRYVGARSNQLVRTVDYNQVDIRGNSFASDFNTAISRVRAGIAAINSATNCTNTPALCTGLSSVLGLTAAGQSTFFNQLNLGTPADTAITLIQAGNTGTTRFLQNRNTGVANLTTNAGKFRYNALQAEVRRRFANGFSLQANYTFQKTLTNVQDDGINQARVAPFLDNANQNLEYSRASYDTAHTFNFNSIFELPFGKGKPFFNKGGLTNFLLGGFQIGNIVQINSGAPILISDARGTLNRVGRSGVQTAASNLTKEQIKALLGYRNVNGVLYYIDPAVIDRTTGRAANGFVLNPSATTPATFAGQVFFNNDPGQTGNVEKYAFNGPIFYNWDANLIKNFSVSETLRFQLRVEAFNLTNSTRFGTPTFNINSPNFGKITTAGSPRILQFGVRFEF